MSVDYHPTAQSPSTSCQKMSFDDSMRSWRQTFRGSPSKTYAIPTYLNGDSESSSGYESSNSPKKQSPELSGFNFLIYNDIMDISMPSLLSDLPSSSFDGISSSYSHFQMSSNSSPSQSLLSFGEFHCRRSLYCLTKNFGFVLDFDTTPPAYNREYEQLRHDFEMNGRTVENDYDFEPSVSSTPKAVRRFDHYVREEKENRLQQWNGNQLKNLPKKKLKPHKASLKDVSKLDSPILMVQLTSVYPQHCVFCKNNGEEYLSHTTKDAKGKVLCPKLWAYSCPICGACGDNAHTIKYCPKKPIVTLDDLNRMPRKRNFKML